MEGEIKHECGVFGVIGSANCLDDALNGLNALQHRGEEQCGVASWQNNEIALFKHEGLVIDLFGGLTKGLSGSPIIAHNRYATCGGSDLENAQPHVSRDGQTALCSNGDLPPGSYRQWRLFTTERGFEPISNNDGELLLRLVELLLQEGKTIQEALEFIQINVVGSFSALVIHQGCLFAFRDRHGIRPLVFGTKKPGIVFVASESCALDDVGAEDIKVVAPGEILSVGPDGSYHQQFLDRIGHAHCIFENIYFSQVSSEVFGIPNSPFREELGRAYARLIPENTDLVIPVPDSANCMAAGLAHASGVRFAHGLIRRHIQPKGRSRSFTAPTKEEQVQTAETKLVAIPALVGGKIVVVVDDSIVRGTTSKRIVDKLRRAGVREVHLRICSPKIISPCYYGINTPTTDELIGANMTVDEICQFIGADSLAYLTVDDLKAVIRTFGKDPNNYCFACFTGKYPTAL